MIGHPMAWIVSTISLRLATLKMAFFRVIGGFMAQFGMHGDPNVNRVWKASTISMILFERVIKEATLRLRKQVLQTRDRHNCLSTMATTRI